MAILVTTFILLSLLDSSLLVAADSCGGVLTDPTGEITSPDYPKWYPNDVTCTWKISPETTHVNLTIEDFALELSKTCNEFDFVKIKVKASRYSTEEVVVCGSLSSRELKLKVEGNEVEITFTSDSSINQRGFNITYRSYDIDPCLQKNGGCSHACSLVKGKRICSCPSGYKLIYDQRTCRDENSCQFTGRKKCLYSTNSRCTDLSPDGNTTCECYRGYKRKEQNGTCQDIDECKETPGRCGVGTCNNRGGYYYCTCPQPGYRVKWHPSGQTCEDVDECKSRGYQQPIANCGDAVCVNTPGSYICQCEPGYKFNDTLKKCQDDDECTAESSGCDHVCTNANGSFSCSCHPGYFLDSDGKSCRAEKVGGLEGVHKSIACQGEPLTMKCKDSKDPLTTLIIFKAEYGRDIEVCPQKRLRKKIIAGTDRDIPLDCKEDVTDKVKNLCGRSRRCDLLVHPTIGKLCSGPVNRYLSVTYSCGKPLKCRPALPRSFDLCSDPVKDECKSDTECKSDQMCCFDGCKKVCSEPAL